MSDRPLEIEHIPTALHGKFDGLVPPATTGTPEERDRNFLTRALAAFAVHKLAHANLDDAAASVVDGGGDGGIDALHYAAANSTLWVVQSKYISDGRGEPSLADVSRFKDGLESLLQGHFSVFVQNEAWRAIAPTLPTIFANAALQVRAVLVYSGVHLISDDRLHLFEDLVQRFSPESEYLRFHSSNLTTVHDWVTGADEGPGVSEVGLTLRKPGWLTEPYETIYGLITLSELAALYTNHGKRLIAANIRGYKGRTEVNEQILATIRSEPTTLFYLNNGLTAFCQRLEVHNLDRANADQKRVRAFGFSIVNGAQTLGSVADFFATPPEAPPDGYVFLKLISLERCPDDREFANRITRSTNFQNQIGARDFAALDEYQERIAKQIGPSGITYHYKDAADTPRPDEMNFTLDEATTACACLAQVPDCDFCARLWANRSSLWSMEVIDQNDPLTPSRYSRVFRSDRSARTIWRAVQTQRAVIGQLQDSARASTGLRKTFFENARWLILSVTYLRLHPERGDDLTLTSDELSRISRAVIEFAELLWSTCEEQGFISRRADVAGNADAFEAPRHLRSVFSAAADCARLRNALLRRIADAQADATTPLATGGRIGEEPTP